MATCIFCGQEVDPSSTLPISICHDCYQRGVDKAQKGMQAKARRAEQRPSRLRKLLLPRYDELSLFLISLMCILVFSYDPEFRADVMKFLFKDTEGELVIGIPLFLAGIIYSLYHVFTSRKKTTTEVYLMLFVAVMTNGLSGVAAGLYMFNNSAGILLLFPLLNIISGAFLIFIWACEIGDEDSVVDEEALNKWVLDDNASLLEVVFGTAMLLVVFAVCRATQLHWSETCSICVAYTTTFHGPLQRSLQPWLSKRAVV